MNNQPDPLRKLARSVKYQNLYARATDLSCIHLFDNTSDFSKVQHEFLYWIALYSRLYQDLAMGEQYLTQEVIDDDLLCDCYLIWEQKIKRKEQLERIKNPSSKSTPNSKRQIDNHSNIPSVVFTKS